MAEEKCVGFSTGCVCCVLASTTYQPERLAKKVGEKYAGKTWDLVGAERSVPQSGMSLPLSETSYGRDQGAQQ